MNAILVNLTPNNKVGFSNHIYIIAKSISYATQNNINLIFYTQYLQEIHTNNYTFISNIVVVWIVCVVGYINFVLILLTLILYAYSFYYIF